jgi:hypothetical protein
MVTRGHLVGVLVLGTKRSGESYAPDESAAIGHVAHGVASAVDVLSLRSSSGRDEEVLQGIRVLRRTMTDLAELVKGVLH